MNAAPRIGPRFAVLLSGLSTALAVAASLFVSRFGPVSSIFAVALSFVLGATVSYVTSYQPLIRMERESRAVLIDIILRRLVTVYRDEIADCHLRANVMLSDSYGHRIRFTRSPELSIIHATEGYTKWELMLTFRPGEGAAGIAYRNADVTIYDARTDSHVEEGMTVEQLVATEHVMSVISAPIHPRGDPNRDPIGVVSLDSTGNVNDTKFNREVARTLLMKCARAIESILQ